MIVIKQVSELLDTGLYETFKPEKTMTVADLLQELNLENKYFLAPLENVSTGPFRRFCREFFKIGLE